MKNIALMSAMALLAIPAMAETSTPASADAKTCCDKPACPSCCSSSDKGVKCGQQEWLNVETVTIEAANGDPLAQYTVAWLSDTGKGMPQDSAKATEMYGKSLPGLEKAAADGNACACLALAHMYAEGKGVEKNDDMAKKYMDMYKHCKKHGKKHCDKAGKCAPGSCAPAADAKAE